ncbi:MAG: MFS transporter, partial [Tepidisphaeraceae bacterium]
MTPLLRLLFSRRMAVLLGLGFASGLPLGLTGATLQAWMTDAGVDLTTIGVFSLVTLPYTLKFAWSPAMDLSVALPLGRRRGWLLLTQIALVVAIAAMAMVGTGSLQLLAATALMVAFFSASQDIVADAYRTDLLIEAERGFGAAVFVTGYRVAMLVATGASLVVVDRYDVPWRAMFLILAGCMGVGMI